MTQRDRLQPMFGFPISPWDQRFAWLPTPTVDRGWIWLARYWRRRIELYNHLPGNGRWWQRSGFHPSLQQPSPAT